MNERTKFIDRDGFVEEVLSWSGVRYLHQGRNRYGVDCIGLAACSLLARGYEPRSPESFFFRGYRERSDQDELRPLIELEAGPLDGRSLLPGDFFLFRWDFQEFAQHLGIMTGWRDGLPEFSHAMMRAKKVEPALLKDAWGDRLCGTLRLRDFMEAGV